MELTPTPPLLTTTRPGRPWPPVVTPRKLMVYKPREALLVNVSVAATYGATSSAWSSDWEDDVDVGRRSPSPRRKELASPWESKADARPISCMFDRRGCPSPDIQTHWALDACLGHPLHDSLPLATREGEGVSKRRQMKNARQTLDNDQDLARCRMLQDYEKYISTQPLDAQKLRHRGLLFAPLSLPDDCIAHFKAILTQIEGGAASERYKSPRIGVGLGKFYKATTMIRVGLALGRKAAARTLEEPRNVGSAQISSQQRLVLQSIFQFYTLRVAGPRAQEMMRRCTWFRFLHHCGLLGKEGGVTFAQGAAVFLMFADSSQTPPMITFSNWFTAIQRVLRGPDFYKNPNELKANLFDVFLKRCEARHGVENGCFQRVTSKMSITVGAQGIRAPQVGGTRSPTKMLAAHFASSDRPVSASTSRSLRSGNGWMAEQPEIMSGWQCDVAEEEMCEPEVITLLHEYSAPLRTLFMHYARKAPRRGVRHGAFSRQTSGERSDVGTESEVEYGLSPSDEERQSSKPSDFVASRSAGKGPRRIPSALGRPWSAGDAPRRRRPPPAGEPHLMERELDSEAAAAAAVQEAIYASEELNSTTAKTREPWRERLPRENFEKLLRDLRLFPEIVQMHSMTHHVDVSMSRREPIEELTYAAFVECLCRIAFVYLCTNGNDVQQAAPSQFKAIWLLSLLRARCRAFGAVVGLPEELVGKEGASGGVWAKRRSVNLESMPLKSMIVWTAMDARVDG